MIDFRFYLVTDRTQCAPRSLASVVHDACVTGVRAVQLREKDLSETDLITSATRLLDVMRPKGAKLLVNVGRFVDDDTALLLAASPGVDGFHLPDDVNLLKAFRQLFPGHLLGASAHSPDRVREARDAGADDLLALSDRLMQAHAPAAVVLGARDDGRVHLVVNLDRSLIERGLDAVAVVREAASLVGGGGGGRPTMARAGGKDPEKLPEALAVAERALLDALGSG